MLFKLYILLKPFLSMLYSAIYVYNTHCKIYACIHDGYDMVIWLHAG